VDQSFTDPHNLGASINECCRYVAQTFTAGWSGTLAGVNVSIFSQNRYPLHVAVRTVTAEGVPSNTILGEKTLASSAAPLSRLINFPETIHILAGVQYAIVVDYPSAPPPGSTTENFGSWSGAVGNHYPGGQAYALFPDGIWRPGTANPYDLHFRTYVRVAPVPTTCNGLRPTIYVDSQNRIVGGPQAGQPYQGKLNGTSGHDVMIGTALGDLISGAAGNDAICGWGGDDHLLGGPGADTLRGGRGNDVLDGDSGPDVLKGDLGADAYNGGLGTDRGVEFNSAEGDTQTSIEVFE
jgi:hypothetical protein